MRPSLALLSAAALAAAARPRSSAAPVKLIIDTDMSGDVDDVAALCIAHALADAGEAELLAVVHNTGLIEGAGAISVINHYFGRDHVPIGAFRGAFDNPAAAPKGSWAQTRSGGPYVEPLVRSFPSPIQNSSQVPLGVEVYRKVLAASPDRSVMISSIGFMSNLAALVSSPPDEHSPLSGRELVARKVKGIGCATTSSLCLAFPPSPLCCPRCPSLPLSQGLTKLPLLSWMGGQYPKSAMPPLCPNKTGQVCPKAEWNFGGGAAYGKTGPPTSSWAATAVANWPVREKSQTLHDGRAARLFRAAKRAPVEKSHLDRWPKTELLSVCWRRRTWRLCSPASSWGGQSSRARR